MVRIARSTVPLLGLILFAAVAGCTADAPPPHTPRTAEGPVETVEARLAELRDNRLADYARHSVPADLYDELDAAWRAGASRWPLTELPLDDRVPGFLQTLAAPGAERALGAVYRREFAGAHAELRSAAATLTALGTRYVRSEGEYSADERAHYLQVADALGHWARAAPLGDHRLAGTAIARLTEAARRTGLDADGALERAGMEDSLRRLGPFFGQFKRVLAGYGLDLDATLAAADVSLLERDGDSARVRVRYALAGRPVEAYANLVRIDGRWYLVDALAHARAQRPPAPEPPPALAAQGE